jgi:hypothetical protein
VRCHGGCGQPEARRGDPRMRRAPGAPSMGTGPGPRVEREER